MCISGHIEKVNPAMMPIIVIEIRIYLRNSGDSRTDLSFGTSSELKLFFEGLLTGQLYRWNHIDNRS